MKLIRLLTLFLLFITLNRPVAAQTPASLTVPIVITTATEAVFFTMGFLDADQDVIFSQGKPHAAYVQMVFTNQGSGTLADFAGKHITALYFYGRALRYRLAAYEAGELTLAPQGP